MIKINNLTFKGMPNNYSKVDNFFSRSAQPQQEDFKWLKEQGVTDIINFRTMTVSGLNFSEKATVEALGMKYHNIPTISAKPSEKAVLKFLNLIKDIFQDKGKVHVHCKAGADRTGMYSFIYKSLNGIATQKENISEWIQKGHNTKKYPDMIKWAIQIVNKITKK